jgi:hypothetical protein
VSSGELFELFGEQIPLEAAARKWSAGRIAARLDTPDRMRFYTLTQYLHWLQCSFTPHGQRKTMRTLVHLHVRKCERCGAGFVAEKGRKSCGCRR